MQKSSVATVEIQVLKINKEFEESCKVVKGIIKKLTQFFFGLKWIESLKKHSNYIFKFKFIWQEPWSGG